MTLDELHYAIHRQLGDVRGRGGLFIVPSHLGPDVAFLMCTKYPIHSGHVDHPLCTHVPLAPPSDELVATLQLYLGA